MRPYGTLRATSAPDDAAATVSAARPCGVKLSSHYSSCVPCGEESRKQAVIMSQVGKKLAGEIV